MFDQVGQYRVLSGQRVYINDPLTLAAVLGDIPQKLNKQTHPPDVILSFSFAPIPRTYPQFDNRTQGPLSDPDRQAHSRLGFNANFVLDTIAATAGFGGNPVLPPEPPQKTGSEHERLSMDPLLFSVDSPFNGAIRVVRSIPDNAYGCDDYPPNVLHDPLAAHPKAHPLQHHHLRLHLHHPPPPHLTSHLPCSSSDAENVHSFVKSSLRKGRILRE